MSLADVAPVAAYAAQFPELVLMIGSSARTQSVTQSVFSHNRKLCDP